MPLRKENAFTLVELIATIAIVAILVAVMVPTVGNFVRQSRETADRQTLAVLNDAINRYKMQGGDVSALTQGKPFSKLIEVLSTPVSWGGVSHQFLRGNGSYESATTIAATGSGRNYRLTCLNSYDTGEGISAPLVPTESFAWDMESLTANQYITVESGSLVNGASLSLNHFHGGSYSLSTSTSQAYSGARFDGNSASQDFSLNEGALEMWVRWSGAWNPGSTFIYLTGGGGSRLSIEARTIEGTLRFQRYDGTDSVLTGTATGLTADAWHKINLGWRQSGNPSMYLTIDDSVTTSSSTDFVPVSGEDIIALGTRSSIMETYIDDLKIWKSYK